MGTSTLTRSRPLSTLLAGAHALPLDGPRLQRMRSTVRSVSHVFDSGAANGAVFAFGWRGIAVVPVVVAMSMLLARLHGRRRPRPPLVLSPTAADEQRAGSIAA